MHEKRQTGANNNRSQLKDLVHFTLTFISFVINFFGINIQNCLNIIFF